MCASKNSLPRHVLEENLKFITSVLTDFEWFVFYGTLLGIEREGNLIEGDDDIDIFINIKHRDELLRRLKGCSLEFSSNIFPNNSKYFTQVFRCSAGFNSAIDFYFYTIDENKNCLVDRFNFFGRVDDKKFHLHVPTSLVFPLRENDQMGFTVFTPDKVPELLTYVYGKNWITPLKRTGANKRYFHVLIKNRPFVFQGIASPFLYFLYRKLYLRSLSLYRFITVKKS